MPAEDLLTQGFGFLTGAPGLMPSLHRHREVEVNLVVAGEMTYLFGGATVVLPPSQLAVFWATIPHQVIRLAPKTDFYCIHVPLSLFLQWGLPSDFTNRLLHGEMVREQDPVWMQRDLAAFEQWRRDLSASVVDRRHIVLLEIEARLWRLALSVGAGESDTLRGTAPSRLQAIEKVEQMAAYIADHYQEEIDIDAIASAAQLHPKYAMTLFRAHCGMTIGEYLSQQRLSQAQRLLATTDRKVVDVALASGFGSLSQFYAVFQRFCGQSPKSFRNKLGLSS